MTRVRAIVLACMAVAGVSAAAAQGDGPPDCLGNQQALRAASVEMERLLGEDQADRSGHLDGAAMWKADLRRRARVAELFAGGCLSRAGDFTNAALIFQHGVVPEHFFQAWVFARRAAELGDESARGLEALAIDRYLVRTGRRQLFGSQLVRDSPAACWCLADVQPDFPDELRAKYVGKRLAQQREHARRMNAGHDCPGITCPKRLSPTPRGTVPGLW